MTTSRTATAALTTPSPAVPAIGWYGLIMDKRQELLTYFQQILVQLQSVSQQWRDLIPTITAFVNDAHAKLESLQRSASAAGSDNSVWKAFFQKLSQCFDDLNTFIIILNDKKNSTPQIIAAFIERIRLWPALIQAFNNLELDLIAGGLFSSVSKRMVAMGQSAASVRDFLPPYAHQQLQEAITWIEKTILADFATYPETTQDVMLLVAAQGNMAFRQAYLVLDTVAIQMNLDLQKLVHEPIFQCQTVEKGATQQTTLLSFHAVAGLFAERYRACFRVAGYTMQEECYPFSHALLTQRQAYPAHLQQHYAAELQQETQRWQYVVQSCQTIVDGTMRELAENQQASWFSSSADKFIQALEHFKENLPSHANDLEACIHAHIPQVEPTEIKSMLDRVRAVYTDAVTRSQNRDAWFARQHRQVAALIAEAVNVVDPAPSIASPALPITTILQQEVPALVTDVKQLLATLMQAQAEDGGTIFDTILHAMQQIKAKCREVLDPHVYRECFEKLPSVVPVATETAWLYGLAHLLQQCEQITEIAKRILQKATASERAATTPGHRFQTTLQGCDALVKQLTLMVQALHQLRNHPFVLTLPSLGAIISHAVPTMQMMMYQTIVEPMLEHPVQVAWRERDHIISLRDQLTGGLRETSLLLLRLVDLSDKDTHQKRITKRGIEQAKALLHAFQESTSVTAFIFRNPLLLGSMLINFTDVFMSLLTLSGDQLLIVAKKINTVFRNVFVLLDCIESQLFLKENYLARLLTANGQTLFELAGQFSTLVFTQGYVFPTDENYPYTMLQLAQRRVLLTAATDKQTELFLLERIASAEELLRQQLAAERQTQLSAHNAYRTHVLTRLEKQKANLQQYQPRFLISAVATHQVALLTQLITDYTSGTSLHLNLNQFSVLEHNILHRGTTGKLLRSLVVHTPEHLLQILRDLQATIVAEKEDWRYGLFRSSASKHQKITALTHLKQYLSQPGWSLSDALREMKEHDYPHYALIQQHQQAWLQPLTAADKAIPAVLRGKKIITQAVEPLEVEFPNDNDSMQQPLLPKFHSR